MSEKLCYNKGCGQKFNENENLDGLCAHHPGVPVFHDAYKGWSCCKKKTTDFTEFLNIKGCTVSRHNPSKPVEPPKPKQEIVNSPTVVREPLKAKVSMVRPAASQKMSRLPHSIGESLKPFLEKLKSAGDVKKQKTASVGETPYGTSCKNAGCKATYYGDTSNHETCNYHEGFPVFHEGMKYWSCCQRKTSDFNTFLEQEGCISGKHCWFKQETKESSIACRYDWHQTGSLVVISVFAKASFPDKSFVDLNPVKCKIHIVFGEDQSVFDTEVILAGIVNVAHSSVEFLGSKVEIKLRKAEPVSWKSLILKDTNGENVSSVTSDLEDVNLDDVEVLVNHEAVEDAKKKFFHEQTGGK